MKPTIYAVQIVDIAKIGLHARPVAKIVGKISSPKFKDTKVEVAKLNDDLDLTKEIKLTGKEPIANGKSILSFIGLQIKHMTKIAFIITGDFADEIIETIKKVLLEEGLI